MSTEIPCAADAEIGDASKTVLEVGNLSGHAAPWMYVKVITDGKMHGLVNPTRADLLAAIAAEFGVIIVDRAELPEVKHFPDGRPFAETDHGYGEYTLDAKDTPERLRGHARALIALAEYLDAHPPVDEAQVEALTAAIEGANGPGYPTSADLARRLVARGVRVEGGQA